ncbi:MAG: TetR family transcriptional regulator C-terminal domain-containing protein [Nocardioides sp.]
MGSTADTASGDHPEDDEPASGRGDARREQMLVAAAEVIAERGLANTRIADVAARIGSSPALVVYYFDTKDNLLTEALRFSEAGFYQAVEELLTKPATLRERLATIIELTFVIETKDQVNGQWGLWFDLWTLAFRHPKVAADRQAIDDHWRQLISRVVQAGIASGEIDTERGIDADYFAVAWAALLDGLSVQVALGDPSVSVDKARRIALNFAHRELGLI